MGAPPGLCGYVHALKRAFGSGVNSSSVFLHSTPVLKCSNTIDYKNYLSSPTLSFLLN